MPSSGTHSATIWSPRSSEASSMSAHLPSNALDIRSKNPRHSDSGTSCHVAIVRPPRYSGTIPITTAPGSLVCLTQPRLGPFQIAKHFNSHTRTRDEYRKHPRHPECEVVRRYDSGRPEWPCSDQVMHSAHELPYLL